MTDGYGPVGFQGQSVDGAMSRTAQEELYSLLLNHLQGTFGTESQIDMVAENGESTPADLEAGMVLRYDATTSTFLRYGTVGIAANDLPYFAKPAGGYSSVPADGNVYGDGVLALPACASYKLCTNNFNEDNVANFTANTPITADGTTSRIAAGTYYDDPICGVICKGVLTDYDKPGRDVVEFFTYWLPSLDTYSETYIEPMND